MLLWSMLALAGAQELTNRVEIEAPGKFEDWVVVPIGEDGVIAIGSDSTASREGTVWTFQRYDTAFRPLWKAEHTVDSGFRRVDVDVEDGAVYVAFGRVRAEEAQIVRCATEDGAILASTAALPFRTYSIDQLLVSGDDAWLAGSGKGGGMLVTHDLSTGASASVPLDAWTRVQRLQREGDHVDAVLSTMRKRESSLRLVEVGGATPREIPLTPGETAHNLLTARRASLSEGREIVVGTYGAGSKSTLSSGVYVAGIQHGAQAGIRFHSWSDFDAFFSWLPEGRAAALDQKLEKKKENSGEDFELQLNYNLLVHDLVERGDELVMVAEAYYPEYQTVTTTRTQTINGVTTTTTTTNRYFVGWRYTHAVVAGIGKDGALLWDHTFPIEGVLTPRVTERVRVTEREGDLSLLYVQGGLVHRKVLQGKEMKDGGTTRVADSATSDVRRTWVGDAEYWYGDDFVAWGLDKVKDDEGKKRVFWFARLSSDESP